MWELFLLLRICLQIIINKHSIMGQEEKHCKHCIKPKCEDGYSSSNQRFVRLCQTAEPQKRWGRVYSDPWQMLATFLPRICEKFRLTRHQPVAGPELFIAMFGPVKGCNNSQRGAWDESAGEQHANIPSQYVCNIVTHTSPTEHRPIFACFSSSCSLNYCGIITKW